MTTRRPASHLSRRVARCVRIRLCHGQGVLSTLRRRQSTNNRAGQRRCGVFLSCRAKSRHLLLLTLRHGCYLNIRDFSSTLRSGRNDKVHDKKRSLYTPVVRQNTSPVPGEILNAPASLPPASSPARTL